VGKAFMGADKSNSGMQEEVRKLRAENEMLRKEIQRKLQEEAKIDELVKKSQQDWIKKQRYSIDFIIDEVQVHYEKKLGILNE
jgi:hypothetical protein